ncbi:hypothetical protein HDV00_006680 [Rhizophlyctis rosea]|nr:hypothetical protein HDV00_006680 [Rhizophlyctis rosea]
MPTNPLRCYSPDLSILTHVKPTHSHPLLAVTSSASYATPPISPAAESPLDKDTELPILAPNPHRPSRTPTTNNVSAITIQPYIAQTRLGGIFIREDDAQKLGLKRVGEAETYYGNVYALPRAFEGTKYHDGVTGVDMLLELGFSVGVDRGMVYLTDPEWSAYGGGRDDY